MPQKISELFVLIRIEIYICIRLKATESCLRGRKDMFAKHAYGKLYQGFESCHPDKILTALLSGLFVLTKCQARLSVLEKQKILNDAALRSGFCTDLPRGSRAIARNPAFPRRASASRPEKHSGIRPRGCPKDTRHFQNSNP